MIIFSGIRPTGPIHIGNYLGAIRNWLELQKNNQCFFCIANLHAITTPFKSEQLRQETFGLAALYLSLGLDPHQSTLFVQSQVKEHAEMTWLLSTITPMGELSRMTQYKEKSDRLKTSQINAGLFYYPVLMAADILLYQTEAVPVGEDQQQHVELARSLAQKFNRQFGATFKIPKSLIPKNQARIRSLRDPSRKMSKTDDPRGAVSFLDSPEEIKNNVMRAVTDSDRQIKYDPQRRPGLANLLIIYSSLENISPQEAAQQFVGQSYQSIKEELSQKLIAFIEPIQSEYQQWIKQPQKLEEILTAGQEQAQTIAAQTLAKAQQKMGLLG